ncbi:hypothetical protein K3172_05415 [Qipengyuania sp. 6B39]|uniref:hypothetical protein n=1 Tax=Qipengyuania proteolytica TaxID=2867239 RepID=UPI001C89F614|nr:hypothetical protein [Qipengyuania proteolytica]MBX7495290.1 hypothetical protein [Qipengyuania proteolytica]
MIAAPGRLAVTLGVVAFAFLALVSGFDRMSETRQSFARFVPQFMQVGAAKRLAAKALGEGDNATASTLATLAIAHDPLDPRGMAYLGAAASGTGADRDAAEAFAQAERISRREPLAQVWHFGESLARGDYDGAAERLDAVLRANDNGEVSQFLLSQLEQSAEGRTALAARLGASPRWADAYLGAVKADDAVLRARAAVLAQESSGITELGCDATLPMIRELARRNYRADAEGIARRHCPAAEPGGLLADADFAAFGSEDASGAIGWQRYRTGEVRVTKLAGEEARLEVESRSSVTRLVVAQPVALDAGTYVIRAKVDGPGAQRLAATLNCKAPARPRAIRERIDREGQRLVATGCPDAVLSLWVRPGAGRVVIDRVELKPLNP